MSSTDSLREQVITLLKRDDGGFFKGYTIYEPRIDELVSFIAQREQAAELRGRIDENMYWKQRLSEHSDEDTAYYNSRIIQLQSTKPDKEG